MPPGAATHCLDGNKPDDINDRNKRQRSASGVAETQMVTEDEGDEGANGSSSGDRQGGDRQNRVGEDGQDGDRQGDESEGNSRATRRQRLGGGGKAGVLT
jgi:hypothetical protein